MVNSPNSASGRSWSKFSSVLARITASYTLMLTIFLMTNAPTICMMTAKVSIFLPIGSVNSNET